RRCRRSEEAVRNPLRTLDLRRYRPCCRHDYRRGGNGTTVNAEITEHTENRHYQSLITNRVQIPDQHESQIPNPESRPGAVIGQGTRIVSPGFSSMFCFMFLRLIT